MKPVRLSSVAALVLHAVSNGFEYGFDIMDATGLPSGTVYPALRRLEQAGFVKASWEAHAVAQKELRPPRRYYEISAAGKESLRAAIQRYPLLRRAFEGARRALVRV